MKIKLLFFAILFFVGTSLFAQNTENPVTKVILNGYSEKAFTSDPVTSDQIDVILKCGMKAPSARNLQPWKFTVVTDEVAMKEIVKDIIPGNVLVIVSGKESENGTASEFDCGLAVASMFIGLHGLGLGAHIYGSPAGNINTQKDRFQIPDGYKALVVLRVGNVDKNVDAVTAATPRKNADEVVNYFKRE